MEAIDTWGLVSVIFQDVTHICALVSGVGLTQPVSLEGSQGQNFRLEILDRITLDIESCHADALIRRRRFLSIVNHQAAAMCEILQEVL